MTSRALRFWVSALVVALGFATAAALLLPYEALRLDRGPERWRAWLLTVWTGGVMCVCFGLAGLLGYGAPLGFREVAEAGSVTEAVAARRRTRLGVAGFHDNFAWWLIVTGALLVGLYFLAWGIGTNG